MNNFQKIKSFFVENKFPILIFFGLSFAISLTFPTGFSIRYSYQLNDIANEPIIAPFDFGILKTEQKLNKDLDEARNSVPFSFSRNQDFVDNQISAIDTFFIYLNDIYTAHDLFISSQDSLYKYRYEPEFESFQSSFIADSTTYVTLYSEFLNQYQFQIEKTQWDQLLGINESLTEPLNLELFKNQIKQICLNRWAEGIIDEPLENIFSADISIIQGVELVIAPTKNYYDILQNPSIFKDWFTGGTSNRNYSMPTSLSEFVTKIYYYIYVSYFGPLFNELQRGLMFLYLYIEKIILQKKMLNTFRTMISMRYEFHYITEIFHLAF